jgi:hypothetical protein
MLHQGLRSTKLHENESNAQSKQFDMKRLSNVGIFASGKRNSHCISFSGILNPSSFASKTMDDNAKLNNIN